ncbi:MAG: hypothetical protein ACO1PB_04700 [Ramlibacter sp.]
MSTTSDDVAAAYGLWTKAHKEMIDAEVLLAGLGHDAPRADREAAHQRVQELRRVSDGILALATELLRRHEAGES